MGMEQGADVSIIAWLIQWLRVLQQQRAMSVYAVIIANVLKTAKDRMVTGVTITALAISTAAMERAV